MPHTEASFCTWQTSRNKSKNKISYMILIIYHFCVIEEQTFNPHNKLLIIVKMLVSFGDPESQTAQSCDTWSGVALIRSHPSLYRWAPQGLESQALSYALSGTVKCQRC